MGHVHAGSMYRSRRKEAKESLCDSLTILLSFESESVWERYRNDMLHDTRHRCITNGSIAEDAYNDTLLFLEAKLALTNKSLHDFPEMSPILPLAKMLHVYLLLATELDYNRDILHGYVDQNLPRLNIC